MKVIFNTLMVGFLGIAHFTSSASIEDRVREDFLKGRTVHRGYCAELLVESYGESDRVGKALNAVDQQVKNLKTIMEILNQIPAQQEWTSKTILEAKDLFSRHSQQTLEETCTLGECSKQIGFIRARVEEIVPYFYCCDTSPQFLLIFRSLSQSPQKNEAEDIKDMRDVYEFLFQYMPEEGKGCSDSLVERHQNQINWYQRFLNQLNQNHDPVDETPHPDNFDDLLKLFNKRLGVALSLQNFYFNTTHSFPIWRNIRTDGINKILQSSDDDLKKVNTSRAEIQQLRQSQTHVLEPRFVELITQLTPAQRKKDLEESFKRDLGDQKAELERRINVLHRSMRHMEEGKKVRAHNEKKITQVKTHLSYLESVHQTWQKSAESIPGLIEDVRRLSQQQREQKEKEDKRRLDEARMVMEEMTKTGEIINWFSNHWFNAIALTDEERGFLHAANDRFAHLARESKKEFYGERNRLIKEALKGVRSYREAYERFVAFGIQ